VPSVLVELGCLSNPTEEHLLQQRAYQQKLARGLVRAIEAYFATYVGR
jgi:N-acetylmuramoyl-L-alanine amidase